MALELDFVATIANEEKAFFAATMFNNISGTSEHAYLFLRNPSASGVRLVVTHLVLGVNSASTRSLWKVYSNPTSSADGTALTETNTYFKSGAASSNATAFRSPTVSANGALVDVKIVPANSAHIGVNRFYWIDPGNDLLLTVQNSVSNVSTFAGVYYLEQE